MNEQFRCNHCHDVERSFCSNQDLARHIDLRHGTRNNYGSIEGPPKKPAVAGTDFERVHEALKWESDLLEDEKQELEAKQTMVEDMMESLRKLGGLDYDGKAPKEKKAAEKTTKSTKDTKKSGKAESGKQKKTTKKPASKSASSVKSAAPSKVGLPPAQGGTAPEGKPFWDKRSYRWTAKKEATEARSHGGTKGKKSPQRYEADDATRDLDSGDAPRPEINASVETPANESGLDAPAGELHVETPLGWVLENNKSNAAMRWGQNRVSGLSDEELEQRINYELGDKGTMKGPDWLATWRRDKTGVTAITIHMEGVEPVVFMGASLVDKVREVLMVDLPTTLSAAGKS